MLPRYSVSSLCFSGQIYRALYFYFLQSKNNFLQKRDMWHLGIVMDFHIPVSRKYLLYTS